MMIVYLILFKELFESDYNLLNTYEKTKEIPNYYVIDNLTK